MAQTLDSSLSRFIEHLKNEQEYHQSRDYLLATGDTVGIRFD